MEALRDTPYNWLWFWLASQTAASRFNYGGDYFDELQTYTEHTQTNLSSRITTENIFTGFPNRAAQLAHMF